MTMAMTGCASNWDQLVDQIRDDDPRGLEHLYRDFSGGVRFLLSRQLGTINLDDELHSVLLTVAQAIRRGELCEPASLPGFVCTAVRRHIVRSSNEVDRKLEAMKQTLADVSPRDREILRRFYLQGQSREEICNDMDFPESQFRLLKTRVRLRFDELNA